MLQTHMKKKLTNSLSVILCSSFGLLAHCINIADRYVLLAHFSSFSKIVIILINRFHCISVACFLVKTN